MSTTTEMRPGTFTNEQMEQQLVRGDSHAQATGSAAAEHAEAATKLWGGRMAALMANAATTGRYAGAKLSCPPTACTGAIELKTGAKSQAWRNPEAVECIVCVEGKLELRFGQNLEGVTELGLFDMVAIPANVRHQWLNATNGTTRLVSVLSIAPGQTYAAVFSLSAKELVKDVGLLEVSFDDDSGVPITSEELATKTTRFATLVPYKKDLNRTSGLPPEATMALSAGSVFPLIVPEGHVGRSKTAPMYGNQGLYMSIAECRVGTDGPPPHAHSDTQESFYILDGSFDICSGFENETFVPVKPHDIFAVPNKIMRTFRNTDTKPSRLLVIIQGPDRMQDTVSFSRTIGEDFVRRFGDDIIDKYAAIRMTFDAEERLSA